MNLIKIGFFATFFFGVALSAMAEECISVKASPAEVAKFDQRLNEINSKGSYEVPRTFSRNKILSKGQSVNFGNDILFIYSFCNDATKYKMTIKRNTQGVWSGVFITPTRAYEEVAKCIGVRPTYKPYQGETPSAFQLRQETAKCWLFDDLRPTN